MQERNLFSIERLVVLWAGSSAAAANISIQFNINIYIYINISIQFNSATCLSIGRLFCCSCNIYQFRRLFNISHINISIQPALLLQLQHISSDKRPDFGSASFFLPSALFPQLWPVFPSMGIIAEITVPINVIYEKYFVKKPVRCARPTAPRREGCPQSRGGCNSRPR